MNEVKVFKDVWDVHIFFEDRSVYLGPRGGKESVELKGISRVVAYATQLNGIAIDQDSVHFWFEPHQTLRLREGRLEVIR